MSANPEVLNRLPDVKAQKGLAANPGKTGEMFDRKHPYYEQKCSKCWVNRNKSFKDAITPSGNCNKCQLMGNCTEAIRESPEELTRKSDPQKYRAIRKEYEHEMKRKEKVEMYSRNLYTHSLYYGNDEKHEILTHAFTMTELEAATKLQEE